MLQETLATCYSKLWLHDTGNAGYMLQETLATCYRKPWLHVTGNPGYMLQETLVLNRPNGPAFQIWLA